MFKEMRRNKQALSMEEIHKILNRQTSGVLALSKEDGYPYAVPISYVYDNGKLYFHSAKEGAKLEAIRHNPKCSFCVIDQDQIIPEKYTTYYRSAIAFGKIQEITDEEKKRRAIDKLALKYAPNLSSENRQKTIEREFSKFCMLEMSIDAISGKEAMDLVRAKQQDK